MTTTYLDARAHEAAGLDDRGSGRTVLARAWDGLIAFGQRRAVAEVARHVRLHGGQPTGDLAADARHIAALRGMV